MAKPREQQYDIQVMVEVPAQEFYHIEFFILRFLRHQEYRSPAAFCVGAHGELAFHPELLRSAASSASLPTHALLKDTSRSAHDSFFFTHSSLLPCHGRFSTTRPTKARFLVLMLVSNFTLQLRNIYVCKTGRTQTSPDHGE